MLTNSGKSIYRSENYTVELLFHKFFQHNYIEAKHQNSFSLIMLGTLFCSTSLFSCILPAVRNCSALFCSIFKCKMEILINVDDNTPAK